MPKTTERVKDTADLQLYDSEFQTDGELTPKAFADNASVICGIQTVTVYQLTIGCKMGGSF